MGRYNSTEAVLPNNLIFRGLAEVGDTEERPKRALYLPLSVCVKNEDI